MTGFLVNSGFRKIVVAVCLLLSAGYTYAQNGQERKRKDAEKRMGEIVFDRQKIVVDKELLDVYVRIMRYQTAWQDIYNEAHYNETKLDDYLTIAVNDMNEGNLKDLAGYLKAIREPSKDVISVNREMMCGRGDDAECSMSYEVNWTTEKASKLKFNIPNTGNVDHYITYNITVEYKEKSVTHAGVIVNYKTKNAGFMIFDGIFPQIDELVLDRMPLMAERRQNRGNGNNVKKLPAVKVWSQTPKEDEYPIGWLPGDEEELSGGGMGIIMMSQTLTPCCAPTLTGPSTVTRGQSATFSLSGLDSSCLISNWKFTGSSGGVVNRTTNTTDATWSGMMVTSGTVSVTVSGQIYSTSITVNPRNNFTFTAVNAEQITNCTNLVEFPGLCLPVTPLQNGDATGMYQLKLPYSFTTLMVNDSGPNHGYWYTTSVTPNQGNASSRFGWTISPDVNNTGSTFYQAQCGNYNASTNPNGFISGAKLKSNTIYHESANSANAHYYQYLVAQDNPNNNMGLVGEAVIGNPGTSQYTHENLVNNAIMSASNTIYVATTIEPCGGITNNDGANGCIYGGGINYKDAQGVYSSCVAPCASQCANTYSQCLGQVAQCQSYCTYVILTQYPGCLYNPSACEALILSCQSNCSGIQSACTNQYNQCLAGCS